jgi:hypothetical protein
MSTEEPLAGSSNKTEEPLAGSSNKTEEPLAGSSNKTDAHIRASGTTSDMGGSTEDPYAATSRDTTEGRVYTVTGGDWPMILLT